MRRGWTCRAAANNQLIPLSLSSLEGHSPFCTSLLLWGHTFPQRFPEQTELSVKRQQREGQHRISRGNKMSWLVNMSLSLTVRLALWLISENVSHTHTNKGSKWGLCFIVGLQRGRQSSPDDVFKSKHVSLPVWGINLTSTPGRS